LISKGTHILFSDLMCLADKMQGCKVMIIGDMVADVYLEGKVARISREAPVLILEHAGEVVVPGGAANTVHNAAVLGGVVLAAGIVGQDSAGTELLRVLGDKGVVTSGLLTSDDRPTITKTRVMAGGQATVRQQIVRIDREPGCALASEQEAALLSWIKNNIKDVSAVVISDYGSGTITPAIARWVVDTCRTLHIPSLVDSRYDILSFTGVSVVKQNEAEAAAALEVKLNSEKDMNQAGQSLLERMNAEMVLITRGPEGMSLFEKGKEPVHMPVTNRSEVYDVTGAGDTVVATMALALAAGASYVEAAALANLAAGVVVRKPGTATLTPHELRKAIEVYYENH
jgi:rfaE bifunctional protein kinase chain/domain